MFLNIFKECFFISMNVSRFDETFKLKKKKSFRRIKSIVEISPVGYFRCCVQWMEFKIVLWMDKNIKRCIQNTIWWHKTIDFFSIFIFYILSFDSKAKIYKIFRQALFNFLFLIFLFFNFNIRNFSFNHWFNL